MLRRGVCAWSARRRALHFTAPPAPMGSASLLARDRHPGVPALRAHAKPHARQAVARALRRSACRPAAFQALQAQAAHGTLLPCDRMKPAAGTAPTLRRPACKPREALAWNPASALRAAPGPHLLARDGAAGRGVGDSSAQVRAQLYHARVQRRQRAAGAAGRAGAGRLAARLAADRRRQVLRLLLRAGSGQALGAHGQTTSPRDSLPGSSLSGRSRAQPRAARYSLHSNSVVARRKKNAASACDRTREMRPGAACSQEGSAPARRPPCRPCAAPGRPCPRPPPRAPPPRAPPPTAPAAAASALEAPT